MESCLSISNAPKQYVIPEFRDYDNLFTFLSIAISCHQFSRCKTTEKLDPPKPLDLPYIPQIPRLLSVDFIFNNFLTFIFAPYLMIKLSFGLI